MSFENKTPGFSTNHRNIPSFTPSTLSITNQTWAPHNTDFRALNFASQTFLKFSPPPPPSNIKYEITYIPPPENIRNPVFVKSQISLVISPPNFVPKTSASLPCAKSAEIFDAFSFLDNETQESYHVSPDLPRYTATDKFLFNAFDSFSQWANQQPPPSLNLPGTREVTLSQSQIETPGFNAPMLSFQADCWMSVKNRTDLNNPQITRIDIKVTNFTIGFFEPMKESIAGLTHTERDRIVRRTRQYEISAKESRDRYIARKVSGDAERPLSRFVRITGKMGQGGSLEIDISRYSWGKNLEWQMRDILKLWPATTQKSPSAKSFEAVYSGCIEPYGMDSQKNCIMTAPPFKRACSGKIGSTRTNASNKSTTQPEPRLDQVCRAFKKNWSARTAEYCTRTFTTVGDYRDDIEIGGINGIFTSPSGGLSHANYFTALAEGISINWTYNHTNGLLDLIEVFAMNYGGFSPNTARELQTIWTCFNEKHRDNPNLKYLHFCHSQGAIHTRNALMTLPKNIRDRVIVVAIAPAAVVPNACCFKSFNYVCKGDPVPLGEIMFAGFWDSSETGISKFQEMTLKHREELILLEPIPDEKSRHDLQHSVFQECITEHLKDYINRNGVYYIL